MWPGLFAVSAGLSAVLPGLPLYIEERFGLTDKAEVRSWASLVFGAGPFMAAIMGPLWGSIGDRVGRKAMVLRSMLAIAVVNALMPLAESPFWLMMLRAIQGVFAGFIAPGIALVLASTPRERQGRVISWLQVSLASGMLFGPLLGAEISEHFGRADVFWFTAAASLLAALPVAIFAKEDRSQMHAHAAGGLLRGMLADLRFLGKERAFLGLLLLLLVMRLGQNMIEPVLALWVKELGPLPFLVERSRDLTHAIDRTTALCLTILAVAQLPCTPLWGWLADRTGPLRCLAAVAFGLALVLFLTASVQTIEGFLTLRCGAAVFMAGSMTLAYAAAGRRVAPERRSLAFSLAQSCIQFGLSVGPVMGTLVVAVDAANPRDSGVRGLCVVAGVCLVVAGIGMVVLRVFSRPRVAGSEPVVAEL